MASAKYETLECCAPYIVFIRDYFWASCSSASSEEPLESHPKERPLLPPAGESKRALGVWLSYPGTGLRITTNCKTIPSHISSITEMSGWVVTTSQIVINGCVFAPAASGCLQRQLSQPGSHVQSLQQRDKLTCSCSCCWLHVKFDVNPSIHVAETIRMCIL